MSSSTITTTTTNNNKCTADQEADNKKAAEGGENDFVETTTQNEADASKKDAPNDATGAKPKVTMSSPPKPTSPEFVPKSMKAVNALSGSSGASSTSSGARNNTTLGSAWTFWLDKSTKGASAKEFEANIRKIYTVTTTQAFWSVFNSLQSVGELSVRYSYHVMRDQRRPVWEDPENCKGGNWRLRCSKINTEAVWQELVVAVMGEQFKDLLGEGDDIIGLSVSVREKDDMILLWNANATMAQVAHTNVIAAIINLLPSVTLENVIYKAFVQHQGFNRETSHQLTAPANGPMSAQANGPPPTQSSPSMMMHPMSTPLAFSPLAANIAGHNAKVARLTGIAGFGSPVPYKSSVAGPAGMMPHPNTTFFKPGQTPLPSPMPPMLPNEFGAMSLNGGPPIQHPCYVPMPRPYLPIYRRSTFDARRFQQDLPSAPGKPMLQTGTAYGSRGPPPRPGKMTPPTTATRPATAATSN